MNYKQIDIEVLKQLIDAKLDIVSRLHQVINFFNRYPVNDCDTGKNLRKSLNGIKNHLDAKNPENLEEFLKELKIAATNNGHGYSGIILGGYFKGMCNEILENRNNGVVPSAVYASSMKEGYKSARENIKESTGKIIEGTMITVMRAAAEAAGDAKSDGLRTIVKDAYDAAKETLLTVQPGYKKELVIEEDKEVPYDAGAIGYVFMLQGCAELLGLEVEPVDLSKFKNLKITQISEDHEYHVQFVVDVFEKNIPKIPKIEQQLRAVFGEVQILQEENIWNVHFHTRNPADMEKMENIYCPALGTIVSKDFEDMADQHNEMVGVTLGELYN